ncbi:glycosyltransferase [Oceaniglobus trochenteri]|uniref:glycosyltransferase n=1 Tax=Oceaniglobus trochenteri TaxID=2763260 RepID=UPI001D0016BD|nr:glycosyltransferase [Oceaniglobus trochenteri]
MGFRPLYLSDPDDTAPAVAPPRGGRLGALLLGAGRIGPDDLRLALAHQAKSAAPIGQILTSLGALDDAALFDALAEQFATRRVDPQRLVPDVTLTDRLGAQVCAAHGVLPLQRAGALTFVATCEPDRFHLVRPLLEQTFGSVSMVLSTKADLHAALTAQRARKIAGAAEVRVAGGESCRSLSGRMLVGGGLSLALALALAALLAGAALVSALTWLALFVLVLNTGFALLLAAQRWPGGKRAPVPEGTLRVVPVSILVPLFRERHIAERLVQRLARLDYPREQLEILLVVEEDDTVTRATLAACALPPHMRCITVPRGNVQTKPRALNYALDFCNGHIVGVYDAEDAPDPGQIRAVVRQFQTAPPQVACLQGRLDYYNPRTNWMARCFTVEYATWFRVMLPGLARLGLVLPLGGTTLFFRKSALMALGGWDAHNVTEDADLGLRLARRGYRTDLLDSSTMEEANCRPWPWVRQRSRWLKGYAMTYFVHMRRPARLWRDLGARRFWGVQILFLGSLLGVFTAPLLWAFALLPLGLPHPWAGAMEGVGGTLLTATLGTVAMIHWGIWMLGARLRGDRWLALWAPTLSLYHLLATAAVIKAAFEIVTRPFFWDKTSHGHLSDGQT